MTSAEPTATDGRPIGPRAQATRRKILDAVVEHIDRDGLLDVRLVDVTQSIGASPATFYQYFVDIDDALLALCDDVTDSAAELTEMLAAPWESSADYDRVVAFVDGYIDYWDRHGAVLRARNLKAEEGDDRFRSKWNDTQIPMVRNLAAMVERSVAAGRLADDIDPYATAAAMVAMLYRLASYRRGLEMRGTSAAALRTTLARILYQNVVGSEH